MSLTDRANCAPHQPKKGSEAQRQTTRVLNMLLNPRDTEDGRILSTLLAAEWDGEDPDDRKRQLLRWLKGDVCPDDYNLYQTGEYLRNVGCPWISGLWLLWASGRFARCIQVIGIMFDPGKKHEADIVDQFWNMFGVGTYLCQPTLLDKQRPFVDFYIRKQSIDDETLLAIRSQPPHKPKGFEHYMSSEAFAVRELAKEAWTPLELHRQAVDVATRAAFRGETIPVTKADNLMRVAFSVADAKDVPLRHRHDAVLTLLGHWFNRIQDGHSDRYPREIDYRYSLDCSVPEPHWPTVMIDDDVSA